MKLSFEKYHGTGNDFILVDNRSRNFVKEQDLIAKLCHRRYGAGADGLILIGSHPDFDFEMIYYNADGRIGSMCGNGGRCAVIFAHELGIISQSASFMAFDGVHSATITGNGQVKLSMSPVSKIEAEGEAYVLDTGSPHYVRFVDEVKDMDVIAEGRKIRYGSIFGKNGINVNFVSHNRDEYWMRTYERGVEDETLSCGTGTVAVAIAASVKQNRNDQEQEYLIHAPGGDLKVYLKKETPSHFTGIFLEGPVKHVYHGEIEVSG